MVSIVQPVRIESDQDALKAAADVLSLSMGPRAKLWVYAAIKSDLIELHRPELRDPGIIVDAHWDFSVQTRDRGCLVTFVGEQLGNADAFDIGASCFVQYASQSLCIRIGRRARLFYVSFDAVSVKETAMLKSLFEQAGKQFSNLFLLVPAGDGYDIAPGVNSTEIKVLRRAADGKSPACFSLATSLPVAREMLNQFPGESSYKIFGRSDPSRKLSADVIDCARSIPPISFWTHSFLGGLKGRSFESALASGRPVPVAEWRDKNRHQFIQFEIIRKADGLFLHTYNGSTQDNV